MNAKQKKVLWIGMILMALMGLFPPWVMVYPSFMGTDIKRSIVIVPAGYAPIFNPPATRGWGAPRLDFSRLFLQWGTVGILVGGLLLILKDK